MARALEELEGAQALPPTQAERDKAMETYIKEVSPELQIAQAEAAKEIAQKQLRPREQNQAVLPSIPNTSTREVLTQCVRSRLWTFGHSLTYMNEVFGVGDLSCSCPATKIVNAYMDIACRNNITMADYARENRHWILKEDKNRKTKIQNQLLEIFGKPDLTIDWKNILKAVHYLLELVAVLERTFSIYTKENGRKVFALIDCICEFFEEAGVDKWITEDGGWDAHYCDNYEAWKQERLSGRVPFSCWHKSPPCSRFRAKNNNEVRNPLLEKYKHGDWNDIIALFI